jgi:hypothetical protein
MAAPFRPELRFSTYVRPFTIGATSAHRLHPMRVQRFSVGSRRNPAFSGEVNSDFHLQKPHAAEWNAVWPTVDRYIPLEKEGDRSLVLAFLY